MSKYTEKDLLEAVDKAAEKGDWEEVERLYNLLFNLLEDIEEVEEEIPNENA